MHVPISLSIYLAILGLLWALWSARVLRFRSFEGLLPVVVRPSRLVRASRPWQRRGFPLGSP